MTSKTVKNFKRAVELAMTQPEIGCPLLDLYYESPSENIQNYITFIKCNYCYKVCKQPFDECVDSIRVIYKQNLISLSEFRTVLGRFLSLKKKGYLS
jgi:hypothetical protein